MGGDAGQAGDIEAEDARAQYAALPFRHAGDRLEILLITSRETKRWVIPKGWPMKRRTPPETAAREAFQEAGVKGRIAEAPVGSYRYFKRRMDGGYWLCEVEVFPLEVLSESDTWREQAERERWWCSVEEAVAAVEEPELKSLIQAFGTR